MLAPISFFFPRFPAPLLEARLQFSLILQYLLCINPCPFSCKHPPPPLAPLYALNPCTLSPTLQEAKLLSGLVNKLGDPSRKVASKAGYLLSSLLQEHPAMKVVVVAEVQRFMFRQGLQERARYYGVVFLNQMVLSHHASQGTALEPSLPLQLYWRLLALMVQYTCEIAR